MHEKFINESKHNIFLFQVVLAGASTVMTNTVWASLNSFHSNRIARLSFWSDAFDGIYCPAVVTPPLLLLTTLPNWQIVTLKNNQIYRNLPPENNEKINLEFKCDNQGSKNRLSQHWAKKLSKTKLIVRLAELNWVNIFRIKNYAKI